MKLNDLAVRSALISLWTSKIYNQRRTGSAWSNASGKSRGQQLHIVAFTRRRRQTGLSLLLHDSCRYMFCIDEDVRKLPSCLSRLGNQERRGERGTDRNTAVWWGEAHWTAHFVPVAINSNTQDGWTVWHSTILLLCAFHPNWKQQLLHDTLSHPSPEYLSGFSQTFNLSSHLQTFIHDFTFF